MVPPRLRSGRGAQHPDDDGREPGRVRHRHGRDEVHGAANRGELGRYVFSCVVSMVVCADRDTLRLTVHGYRLCVPLRWGASDV